MDGSISGSVAPGFEGVEEVLREQASDFGRGGGAFAAYVDGRLVVDLRIGEARPGVSWTEDTLAVLMSATKGLSALVVALLVERGALDVDEPVARYWPEFAANGKDGILVRDVLTHASGVVALPGYADILDFDGTGFGDSRVIVERLAEAIPAWEPGTQHGYHAMTFGWLVGELVRRTTGRSLGAVLQEDVAEPLGIALWLGLPAAKHAQVATVFAPPALDVPELVELQKMLVDPGTLPGQALFAMRGTNMLLAIEQFMNDNATVLSAELGGANACATAPALARVYALLAGGGELDGVRLLSSGTVKGFAAEQRRGPDVVAQTEARWALGFQRPTPLPGGGASPWGPTDETFGHHGYGGQVGFADPVRNVAAAYLRNDLSWAPTSNGALVEALYACLDAR